MDKLATMDTIGSSFRPWLSCQGICLLNRHQTGDTDSVQPVILLLVQRDSQETFIPCEARMLWYSADRTSSQQLRDTTQVSAQHPGHERADGPRDIDCAWQRALGAWSVSRAGCPGLLGHAQDAAAARIVGPHPSAPRPTPDRRAPFASSLCAAVCQSGVW